MMNIRDFIFINKAKNVNKIRILDILGFESNTFITQSPESYRKVSDKTNEEFDNEEFDNEDFDNEDFDNEELYNITLPTTFNDSSVNKTNLIDSSSTETFEPINMTLKIKKIWTDIEKRRKWVVPSLLILSTLILITAASSIIINKRNSTIEIENLYETLSLESNNLIKELPEIINISTESFYSKYDVSNASANLQIIESTLMEYDRNLINREGFSNNTELNKNLTNIFLLIDELDDLISYRILRSEILIYNDLLIVNDNLEIDYLASQLSEISAKSKRNYENLPLINEFDNDYILLSETLNTAEELHGRLIAALRNNEFELGKSLMLALKMNKEIANNNFDNSLVEFKNNKTNLYNNISKLP